MEQPNSNVTGGEEAGSTPVNRSLQDSNNTEKKASSIAEAETKPTEEPTELKTTTESSSDTTTNDDETSEKETTEKDLSKKRSSELAAEEEDKPIKRQEVEKNSNDDKKKESSSRDVNEPDSKPFGGRILTDESAVFEQNAWDHAPWGEEQEQHAQKEIARQKLDPVPAELVSTYHAEAADNWNKFYAKNENRFFKDRHWLRIEFPELFQM
ncbi:hypothetical protein BGZ46_008357, partial [Entomortierella lignicola]